MSKAILWLTLLASYAQAAEFVSGQAARAVIGQSAFSKSSGINGAAAIHDLSELTYSAGTLTFTSGFVRYSVDTTEIPTADADLSGMQGSGCILCGFVPSPAMNSTNGVSSSLLSIVGTTVVRIDGRTKRINIWRDTSQVQTGSTPDVVLGKGSTNGIVDAATIVEPRSVLFDGQRLFVGDAALHRVLVWNKLPARNGQAADAVLGQKDLRSSTYAAAPQASSIVTPGALASNGADLFVADTSSDRILVFTAADTPLAPGSVVNSASYSPTSLAPGTLITLNGDWLSDQTETAAATPNSTLPVYMGGVQVYLDGTPLPLLSVTPTQIRAQLPYNIADRSSASLYVRTEHQDGSVTTTNSYAVPLSAVAPGLFAVGPYEPRAALAIHTNDASPVTAENPARAWEEITLWADGLGLPPGTSANVPIAGTPFVGPSLTWSRGSMHASINDRDAIVKSALLTPGSIGIYEVHLQVPADAISGDTVAVQIHQLDSDSNTVTVPIKK